MSKKRKGGGGNPRKRSGGGRVTSKVVDETCAKRSGHRRRPSRHLFTTHRTVNGVRETMCSWCAKRAPGSPVIEKAKGPEPEDEVPEDWFSDEDPVCVIPIAKWRLAHNRVDRWPEASQQALLAALE